MLAALLVPTLMLLQAPDTARPRLDRSRPVPAKAEIIAAWQKRQSVVKTFHFAWTEQQTHPSGWLSNPRYAERERASIAGLMTDRHYSVAKTLTLADNRMRYSFELDRAAEPDGIRVVGKPGETSGLGLRRNYSYLSVFDGRSARATTTSLLSSSPPPAVVHATSNIDAQNLDGRAILMAFRPLDSVLGHLLIERAVTNGSRTFYKDKSIFLLEEQHDPSGWKTVLWIEPERDFIVTRYVVMFEQKPIVDMDIDYVRDTRWGWVPSGWRITGMLADGTKRLLTVAAVSTYRINQPIADDQFR